MGKKRFRDVKQGRIKTPKIEEDRVKINLLITNNRQKVKAALTDSFMLMMPILFIVMYPVMGGREGFEANKIMGWIYILIPFISVQTGFMWFGNGQTPGYRNYNIKVVDSKTLENPPLFSIIFRNMLMVLSLVTVIGWMMMFFRKDKKGLHDMLSQTMVINVK